MSENENQSQSNLWPDSSKLASFSSSFLNRHILGMTRYGSSEEEWHPTRSRQRGATLPREMDEGGCGGGRGRFLTGGEARIKVEQEITSSTWSGVVAPFPEDPAKGE